MYNIILTVYTFSVCYYFLYYVLLVSANILSEG